MERTLLIIGFSIWSLALTTLETVSTKFSIWISDKENIESVENKSFSSYSAGLAVDCSNTISGYVFKDENFNGINDGESGVENVTVNAYNSGGTLVGFGISDAAGEYQIVATTVGTQYRIEFELPTAVSDWATPTIYGMDNGSMIQFAQPGSCINLGLVRVDDVCLPYAQVATNLGTPFPDGKLLGAGAAFVSCGSIENMPASSRYVVGVMDFRTINYTNNRSEQVPEMFHHKSWVVDSIGTIFGTDVDDNGNMYAAASSHYGAGFGWGGGGANYSNAVLNFGGIGGGDNATSAGTIYKLDAITGKARVFVQLPQQSFTYTAIACEDGITKTRSNVGVGLGNVEYDEVHDQFFASNFEDGKIYRINKNGVILNSFDPQTLTGFAADNGTPGWAADAKPYGLAVEPNGNRLFFGTHEKDESPGLYSVDLDASGDFSGTELKHSDVTGEGILGYHYAIKPGWIAISDLEFSPNGDLMIGTRTGCANNYASSHNHGAGYKIYTDSDSNGKFDNLTTSPDIQYNNDATGNDDGYGGIGIWNKHDGSWQFAVSSSDIVAEPGPHGILLFPDDWANSGNGSSSYALQPSAAVPYIPSLNINDFKGIGGDVTSYSPCHYNPIEIGQLLWEDSNKNGIQDAGEEGIANVTLRLFDKYCTPVGVTQTSASGEYFFNSSNVDTLGGNSFTGLAPNTTYYITLGAEGDWNASNNEITIGSKDYELTLKEQGSKSGIDNNIEETTVCGALTDVPVITVNTDDFGYVDHSFDIGLKFCPKLLGIDVQQSGTIVTSICKGEALDLKLSHTIETGDVAIYSGPSGLTTTQLYDFANHSTNSIVSVYSAISPLVTNTMTLQTGLVPSLSSVTYYFVFADGNTNIEDSCQPMQSVTVIISPPTPAANLDAGPHEICSENSPYVAGDENVIDLNGYVTSGYQGGTWSTTNTTATANLNGSTFTAVKALAGETINFRYTVPGAMPASGTSCDDNIYTIEIEVKECYATLGNIVWEDKNGNGVQDDGATGIPGVTVELYECPGGVKGTKLETKTTNSNGNYLFDKLPDGEYCVKFDLSSSTIPEVNDLKFTEQNSTVDSGDDTNDSDASPIDGCSSSYTLVAEDEELTVDAGVYIPSKLGDYVWEDENYNGVQDSNEPGIENVAVTLSGNDGLGNTITAQTTTTDNTGMYMFGDLVPGEYNVTFSQPTGYGPTAANDPANNGNDELDSDANPDMSLITPDIPVESGDTIPNIDAGFIVLSKLGDLVWEDKNGNGVQDSNESGIQFVNVTLTGTDGLGAPISPQTVTTDANGMYMFGDLYPGDYVVTFAQPDGYEPTKKDDPSQFGDDDHDSDADPTDNLKSDVTTILSGDTIPNVDAGFVILSKIGDLVWEDDNYNGVQDAVETGVENATVALSGTDGFGNPITTQTTQTDGTGMYMFGDLWPGTYTVTFSQPTDMVPTTLDDPNNNGDDEDDSDANPNSNLQSPQTVIVSGDTIPNVDAGFVDLVQLGNLVWEDENYNGVQDNGESGIENVTVTLNGTDGMNNPITPQVLQTNGNGAYCFTDLYPGDYNVVFSQPAGYVPTVLDDPKTNGDDTDDSDANPNDNLKTITHTLTSGVDNKTLDAGFVILSKLGDLVWEDDNYNGVQDSGEPGINNSTVTLTGTNGLGDAITPLTTQTDNTGMYMFGDLYPGDYTVTFSNPTGYVPTAYNDPKNNGNDKDDSDANPTNNLKSEITNIISGDTIPNVDAGFVILSKLGDFVWEDVNYNGVQDLTEPGIANVIVTLNGTNGLGDIIPTQVLMTDGIGMYMFGDLYPGEYTLTFEQPIGFVPTVLDDPKSNGDDEDDSDANPTYNLKTTIYPVVSGDTIPTIDAGFLVLSKLGDLVWEDMNGNAIQNATEPGIENVTVTLTGINGLGDVIAPVAVQTDADGMYMIGDIYPGNYQVTFEQPTGFVPTKFDDPSNFGDDENDSDADETDNLTAPVTLIQSGDTIPNLDAGFLILSELGDKVWEDLNGNGIQNGGEPGISNTNVTLTGTNGLGNPITPIVLQTTQNGMYDFENLWPGDYTVTFENPTGFVPTDNDDPKGFGNDNNDSDADTNDNLESPVTTLESGDDVNDVDAGFLILSKIGDVVWEDVDGNAIQNSNEPGIENVTVTLTGTNGFGDPINPSVLQTSATGMYMFGELWPGEYVVTFSQPDGYVPTPKDDPNVNGDDLTDSDADPNNNLQSPETTIVSGDTIPTIDGGFLVLAEIGDFAWQDYDADGVQDSNEDPFENIDLTLTGTDNMNNPVLIETTTDENGNYDFGDIWPGTYIVSCGLPTDLIQTIYEAPTSVEENDNDFDLVTNQTTPISIVSKDTFHYLDAGFYGEDFGDAPNTFETTESQNGPVHVIQPNKYLGTGVDAELNGKPQATSGYTGAGGDDNDPSNYEKGTNPTGDENGVTFITPMIPGHEACIKVVTTAFSGSNYLTGWIDFDGNGNFESIDQLLWKSGGSTTPDLLITNGATEANYCFDVPTDATFDGGETHSRFRLSCETGVQPTGRIIGGEVEDYYEAFAKIGNLVWRDYEFEGDQDEPTYDGFNGVEVQLIWEGLDGILGNADDVTYSTTTSEIDEENGKYCFFGAVPGDYTVRIPTIPAGFEPTQSDMTGDENNDSDGVSVDFTIAEDFNLPEGENGMTDNPTGHNYPDKQDNLQFDFGFIAFDYGDLPAGFPTKDTDAETGAHHSIIPCMYLGNAVDSEEDGAYEPNAGTVGVGGDDNTLSPFIEGTLTGTSDEDGVEFITPLVPGAEAKIKVTAKAPAGGAVLNAWIDFNGDGDFINDPTEQVVFTKTSTSLINSQDAAIAESTAPVEYVFCFEVPADATFDGGETHVRIRLSKDGADYDGFAVGGEVEDYWIPFAKVGNYVWYDANHNGLQDEPIVEGHDGVTITLTWAGFDETLGTADDYEYTTVSATDENGVKGKYCFLGLQGGENYSLEATVPNGFVTTKETTTGVDENDSNTPVIAFTMPDDVTNLPVGENGTEDNPGQNHGYPDNQDNLEFDFGVVAFDFGDLPDEFKSTTAKGGAYHVINKGMYLGTCVDSDADAVTDTDAGFDNIGGDDEAGSAYFEGTSTADDEDGFRLISPMIPGKEACVEITSTMPIGTDGIVNIFVDFNGDGDFENDPNESVYFTKVNNNPMGSNTNGTVTAGENVLTKFSFTVPADATFEGGETHVRVRLSPSGFLSYDGEGIGGEVEDYYIPMAKVGSLAWLDYNDDGIQNEPDYAGYNGLKIELTAPGSDATLGTADDIIYDTFTADNTLGQKGTWDFCGLPEGDYQVEIFPEGLYPAKEGIGSEDQDSDPLVVPFTIGHTADGLYANENGMNEDPNGTSFPDDRNLLSIDFGFLAFDFGDIPDGFETFLETDGARHIVKSELFMGTSVDIESDAHTDFSGGEGRSTSGDNMDPGLRTVGQKDPIKGDEDGIRLLTPMIPGDTALLEIRYNSPDDVAFLNAFIDFGGNEKFAKDQKDAVEFLFTPTEHRKGGALQRGSKIHLGKGSQMEVTTNPELPHGHDITCLIPFLVPEDATFLGGDVHLRFRLSTEGELDYNGIAFDGEVEDYWFPVACAGNWVWYDHDKEGDQNESADLGMNDFEMYLQTPGLDGVYGTDDDFKYYQNTTEKDGIDGRFDFCGLIEGTYRVGYDEYPDYMIPAIPDHVSDDEMDSGGLMDEFTVSRFADNAPEGEHGMADDMSNKNDFPDNQVTSNLDFGFIMDPVLGSALAIQGVDFAESNTCGHFNATYDMCIEAFEVTDLNNLKVTLDFDEPNRLGDGFINLVKDPEVIESTATTLPTLNPNYDGANNTEMFDGMSGLMEKGQKICYRFTIEIDPDAIPNALLAQAELEGGVVNDSGVEVPDLINGGQSKERDLTDSGLDPSTTNQGVIGDTGGLDDATPVSDCWESSSHPACNDNIQISLDGNGQAIILGDHINEGLNAPCNDATLPLGGYYQIEIMDGNTPIGNTIDCRYIGQTLTVKSTHVVNCNPCWGTVTIEDKWAPEITCSRDTVVDCTADLEVIGNVFATDNCDVEPVIQLIDEDTQIDECNETVIVKSYQATDIYGNVSQICEQTIRVLQAPVTFPDDVTWTCEQYAFNQGIIGATSLHPAILENAARMDLARLDCDTNIVGDDVAGVAPYQAGTSWWTDTEDLDVTLDPRYDDNVDNPNTDTDALCGTTTSETDLIGYNLSLNVGCQYLERCDLNPNGHTANFVQVPIYDLVNSPVEGLEDADILELTGSGVPNVMDVETGICKFAVAFKDDILEACEGTGTATTFKILRTWTVTNWCTGEVLTDLQIIKVLDKKAPVISFAGDFSNKISVDQSTGGAHQICTSSGIIDVPTVTDNCTGIANLQLQTPAGQGVPVYDNDGNLTGFEIETPYLEAGSHEVTYIATDFCGNTSTATTQIDVIDSTPPVAICRELTKVSLSTFEDGITTITAEEFNEGSYDNCSPVYFKVLKEVNESCANANIDKYVEQNFSFRRSDGTNVPGLFEFFDDDVKFCCEEIGTTVKVRLRVYDVNPGQGAVLTNIFPNQPATGDYLGHINVPSHLRNDPAFKDADHLNYRYNDCVIEVNIEDKSRPVCIAPADVWTTCSEVADNIDWQDEVLMNDLYGEASGYDNCSYDVENVSTRTELDLCGVGNITRTFRTVDGSDNGSVGSCRQVIMIQPVTDYCITFPADFEGECDANYSPAELTYEENGCDLLAINKERTDFFAGSNEGECKKEFFTWSVINWCEYDGVSAPVVLSRDGNGDGRIDSGTYCSTGTSLTYESNPQIAYTSTGFYTWEQHIKIFDNTAPVVTYDGDVVFDGGDLDENPCTGAVNISLDITEECTDQITSTWQLSAFSETFANTDYEGTGSTINGRYPLGTHTARFIVSDDCGNTSWEDVTFEIIDTKAPTPVCFNGLSVQLMPTGMVEIWASDLDASSFDYCHDIEVTANVVEDRILDGVINSTDYLTTAPTDKSILLTCEHVGIATVQLWVTELSDDGVNQSDFCVTYVEVQDNNNACDVSKLASIGGEISDESGQNIKDVEVQLSGASNLSQTTKGDGMYNIVNLLSGDDYSVAPRKNDDIRNGVSTFDLALISKHVLNIELLNSPYKMIAADANKSGSITTLDLVAIRKVILWVSNEFPNNQSWRFVDKDFQFDNPRNPFGQSFPETKSFNNLTSREMANFIGVKIGDVNGDAQPQSRGTIKDRSEYDHFLFDVNDIQFEAGEEIEIAFNSNDLKAMMGYQFTLHFDTKAMELVEILDQTATQRNFGQTMIDQGILTASWNRNNETDANELTAFKLVFKTLNSGRLSELIAIDSEYTTAEAYTNEGEFRNVGIDFGTKLSVNGFALHQNQPNPFMGNTVIGFDLPTASEATLTVTDILGKPIKTIKDNYSKGYNEVALSLGKESVGIYIYTLKTPTHSASAKMKLIK